MPAHEFAEFLDSKIREQQISKTDLARQAGISRQTLYKLLNAEREEARLKTIVQLSGVLKTHPLEMLCPYFSGQTHEQFKNFGLMNQAEMIERLRCFEASGEVKPAS